MQPQRQLIEKRAVDDVPTLFTMQFDPAVDVPHPGERSNPAPEDPMQLWGSLLNDGASIKEKIK
jgi:hypothetical protein